MSELVDMIMQDIGLYGVMPGTFPELLTWMSRSAIAVCLLAGMFKTVFWFISILDRTGKRGF